MLSTIYKYSVQHAKERYCVDGTHDNWQTAFFIVGLILLAGYNEVRESSAVLRLPIIEETRP